MHREDISHLDKLMDTLIKNINIPKILLISWILISLIFIVARYVYLDLATLILITAPFLFPCCLVFLIVYKILEKNKTSNIYLFITLILYGISTIVVYYLWSHAFDNFMNFG